MDTPSKQTIQAVSLGTDGSLMLVIDGKATHLQITKSALIALLKSAIEQAVAHGGNT